MSARFDTAAFRQVLGHFPTGVTVVASLHEDEPVGLAVGSFTSVSLDPPLVAFCPSRGSSSWPKMQASGAFCVSVLGAGQEHVARRYATPGAGKWQGIGWSSAPSGSPILDDCLAWIDCAVEDVYEAGDHFLVVGRVTDLAAVGSGGPLVFFRSGYGTFTV